MTEATQKWLEEVTGKPQTEQKAKWFLCVWHTKDGWDMTHKDRAEMLQGFVEHPTSYRTLEEEFFETVAYDKEQVVRETKEIMTW